MKKFILILSFTLLIFHPRPAYPSAVGIRDFSGTVTVRNSLLHNNTNGIQMTTTNAASSANKTIDNLWIFNNILLDHQRNGIKLDFANSAGGITIRNNSLDNTFIPSSGPNTQNGRFGIQIRNNLSPSIANNTVTNFGRSGIRLQSIANITVINNILYSNGSQDYSVGDQHYASGLQAQHSTFVNVADNMISSNYFSGIAAYSTGGTIGNNNTIRFGGDSSQAGSVTGNLVDCVQTPSGGGTLRGGVMVRDLQASETLQVLCSNSIYSNYWNDMAKKGQGEVFSCGNAITSFFATADDAIYYYDGSSGPVDHNCAGGVIDAAGEPFGVIIEGSASDVTLRNCTIKNAAMNKASRATATNGSIIGAGIFIINGATPSISNNYIFSNGWALLDDRVYTEAGASGIMMRCAEANTSIVNNIIASNANDGLVGRETGGLIGVVNQGNTFRNNGRGGIGLYDGITRNLEIAYNVIHNNRRGIGALSIDGDTFTISNNIIYTNQGSLTASGGITFNDLSGTALLYANTIRNNSAAKNAGGIGVSASNGTFSFINNEIMDNISSYVGGVGFNDLSGATVYLSGNTVQNNSAVYGGGIGLSLSNGSFTFVNNRIADNSATDTVSAVGGMGFNSITNLASDIYLDGNTFQNNSSPMVGGLGIRTTNATVSAVNNVIYSNSGNCIGGFGIDTYGGTAQIMSNRIYSNVNSKSDLGAGGLAFDYNSGSVTVSNNSIYNNTNTATGSGGLGFNHLQAGASVLVDSNNIFGNTGHRVGGIGITNPSTNDVTISGNTIRNNAESGLSISSGSFYNIQNNFILSNGLDDLQIGDEYHASGIQLKDSTFTNNDITGNSIRNNRFSGIALYNTGGTIGPNNVMQYNGDAAVLQGCSGLVGPGSGDGAVSARDISGTLDIVSNVIENNYINSVTKKDCGGTVRLDGSLVGCTRGDWDETNSVVFINGGGDVYLNGSQIRTANPVIDCAADGDIPDTIANGNMAWGIAMISGATGVTIKNCTIQNNMTIDNSYGPDAISSMGGGILVGPNVEAYIYSNLVRDNGFELQPEGYGGNAGIVMRCAHANTVLKNNIIASNKSDGINSKETSGTIGALNATNYIRNNGRRGIGITGSSSAEIAYNDIYSNDDGGIGLYKTSGSPDITNNSIYNNTGAGNPGGIGVKSISNGTISIRNNIISGNSVSSGTDIPAGIGIVEPLGGNLLVDSNIIASNTAPGTSDVGGIGLRGTSSANPGTLTNVWITSNRVSNHRSGSNNQAAVAFKWLDLSSGSIYIRNNDKDSLGLSNNATGVRFSSLINGSNVTIQSNLILNNINPNIEGGAGIEFKDSDNTNVFIDNNILSNCQFSNATGNKAIVAFKDVLLYSSNYIQLARNRINSPNVNGLFFKGMGGNTDNDVAKISIGLPGETPGTSNDFINMPALKHAIAFSANNINNLGIGIYNNNNIQGGIAFTENKFYYVDIIGNSNIYSGDFEAGGIGLHYSGIQFLDSTAGALRGATLNNPVPFSIANNAIKNNREAGILMDIDDTTYYDLFLIDNTIASNGYDGTVVRSQSGEGGGFKSNLDMVRHTVMTGNTVMNNGWSGCTKEDSCSGLNFKGGSTSASYSLTVAKNVIYGNYGNGIAHKANYDKTNSTITNNIAYNNSMDGIGLKATTGTFFHNTFAYNGAEGCDCGQSIETNNIYWGNGSRNDATDPSFVSSSAPYDLHLLSTSDRIDAGSDAGVSTDFDGDTRAMGSGYDMGADEFEPLAELQNDAENPTAQRTDGSQMVDIYYEGQHPGSSTVSYVGANCQYSTDSSSWFAMSTAETTESFTSSWTDYLYTWDVGTDLANTEDNTVYVRVMVNDTDTDSNQWTEPTAFAVDLSRSGHDCQYN